MATASTSDRVKAAEAAKEKKEAEAAESQGKEVAAPTELTVNVGQELIIKVQDGGTMQGTIILAPGGKVSLMLPNHKKRPEAMLSFEKASTSMEYAASMMRGA